jgi:hypothetical protein
MLKSQLESLFERASESVLESTLVSTLEHLRAFSVDRFVLPEALER